MLNKKNNLGILRREIAFAGEGMTIMRSGTQAPDLPSCEKKSLTD
jgi:hypothetical protein